MLRKKTSKLTFSRRECLSAGLTIAAVAAGTAGGCSMLQRSPQQPAAVAALPWPYPEFDIEQVRRRGYEYKYEKACMYGVVKAIATSAAEHNPQWSTLPLDVFYYGRGGAYLWGTLCGALNGGLFVLTLALGDCPQAADDLMTWYVKAQLPSMKHDAYCRFKDQQQTISGSPLCHQSVGRWIKKTGFAISTPERIERCAKISGDTAACVADILNRALNGEYKASESLPDPVPACMGCHFGPKSVKDNSIGKMQCLDCHDDHRTKKS